MSQAQELLPLLSLQEKIALLSGIDFYHTAPVPRLGIPSLRVTDGPHGVRCLADEQGRKASPATAFPTGTAMAATWNPRLLREVGSALGKETLASECHILLGPCINLIRNPLGGRNFECLSEDPHLTAEAGKALVEGMQAAGVGSCLKHFACNNQETHRRSGNSVVDGRSLREVYLYAFERIVKETQPWTLMGAYNRVNGTHACENVPLLRGILRDEWGYKGVTISDWKALMGVESGVLAGLDIEMPGPGVYRGPLLETALRSNRLDMRLIDESAMRILELLERAGLLNEKKGMGSDRPRLNAPQTQATALEAARESIVLLENDGILPFKGKKLRRLALIGPNALDYSIGGGGSSFVMPPWRSSLLENLQSLLPDTEITVCEGCDNWDEPPLLKACYLSPADSQDKDKESGLDCEFFIREGGREITRLQRRETHFVQWWDEGTLDRELGSQDYVARWTGFLEVPRTGHYLFQASILGGFTLRLDGKEMLSWERTERADSGSGKVQQGSARLSLQAGVQHAIAMEYRHHPKDRNGWIRLRFGWAPDNVGDDRLQRAVAAAREADAALVVVGVTEGYEEEGNDRKSLALPSRQDELVAAVAEVQSRTVVALNAGAAYAMPWRREVAALLHTFYGGMQGARALAEVVTGATNPSGKLPLTTPERYSQTPASLFCPGRREVQYGEGLFVGYRWFDKLELEPAYAFGHGLSYATFAVELENAPSTQDPTGNLVATVRLQHIAGPAGSQVVQLYWEAPTGHVPMPTKSLVAFAKVWLQPGEEQALELEVDARAFHRWEPEEERWVPLQGEGRLHLGFSSREIHAQTSVELVCVDGAI